MKPPRAAFYVSTYCNFAHRMRDGKPVEHECRIIPPAALDAEREGNFQIASEIMQASPLRMMRNGVRRAVCPVCAGSGIRSVDEHEYTCRRCGGHGA